MGRAIWILRRVRLIVLAGATAAILPGCGMFVAFDAAIRDDPSDPPPVGKVAIFGRSYEPQAEAASRFAAMALFSQAVYRDDLKPVDRWGGACKYLKPGAEVPTDGMPKGAGGAWKRWTGHPKACLDEDGLAYETYVWERSGGSIEAAVIAFRGTENVGGQIAEDWGSNFAMALGIEPPEYRRAQAPVKELVAALDVVKNGIPIYATGHSLGGGLAQQAGYLSKQVRAVYAFNSSPVTNWSNLAIKQSFAQQEGKGPVIEQRNPFVFRVYHRHEGLQYLRDAAGRFVSRNLNRRDYEFHFKDGGVVESHSMALLACNLARAFEGPTAEFWLTREFAEEVTGPSHPVGAKENAICPPEIRRALSPNRIASTR